ncbi:MAG: hypothetical protein HQL26_04585 [Candidatus Omnitrophica bacterium]|nr:hypothetical protein [Candidatus Omnitrophota bacterium]
MTAVETKRKRVLLMYITKVSGHRQATIAIQKSLKAIDPTLETPAINGFGYTYPILEKMVNQAYMSVIKTTPQLWDYLYDNPKFFKRSQNIKKFLFKSSHAKLERLFKRHDPSVVVCTQAFPCGMVADFKRQHNLDFKIVGVLTDFAPHSYWINDGVDYYVVPSQDSKERFMAKGVPAPMIKVYGIPVKHKFAQKHEQHTAARNLGLDPSIPLILVMGGGQGLGPIKKIVKSLSKINTAVQIVVLAGNNKKVIDKLKKLVKKSENKIMPMGFLKNVDEYMDAASVIITKPGGITTAESLVKGLPMAIIDPLPGQEMRNTDFLIKNGIAIRVDSASDIGEEIEVLLKTPSRLAAMRKAALEFSYPDSSMDIARLIMEQL